MIDGSVTNKGRQTTRAVIVSRVLFLPSPDRRLSPSSEKRTPDRRLHVPHKNLHLSTLAADRTKSHSIIPLVLIITPFSKSDIPLFCWKPLSYTLVVSVLPVPAGPSGAPPRFK